LFDVENTHPDRRAKMFFGGSFCLIVSEHGGRDHFPNGPRQWWVNKMPLRPKHSRFIRPDASERRKPFAKRRSPDREALAGMA